MTPPREMNGGSSQRTSIVVLLMAFTWKAVGALVGAVNEKKIYQSFLSIYFIPVSTISTVIESEYAP